MSKSIKSLFFHCCYSKKKNTEPKTIKETVTEISGHHHEKSLFLQCYKLLFSFLCWNLEYFKKTKDGIQTVSYWPYTADGRTPSISIFWQIKHPSNSSCSQYQMHLVSNNFSIQSYIYLRTIYYFTLKWEGDAFPYFALEAKKIK